jgi:hypothetical protein
VLRRPEIEFRWRAPHGRRRRYRAQPSPLSNIANILRLDRRNHANDAEDDRHDQRSHSNLLDGINDTLADTLLPVDASDLGSARPPEPGSLCLAFCTSSGRPLRPTCSRAMATQCCANEANQQAPRPLHSLTDRCPRHCRRVATSGVYCSTILTGTRSLVARLAFRGPALLPRGTGRLGCRAKAARTRPKRGNREVPHKDHCHQP